MEEAWPIVWKEMMSNAKSEETGSDGHYELTWLLSTRSENSSAIRSELLKTIHEPVAIAGTLHAFTFCVACLAYFTLNSSWPLLWLCSETVFAPIRLFLLWRLQGTASVERLTSIWLHRVSTLWFLCLGLAVLGCLRSGGEAIVILTSNLIIALQGGIASRLAATPRFAALLSIALIAPSMIGVWGVTEAWVYAVPATFLLCFFGMHQLTRQNHKILCDKISAEHKNLAQLMRDPLTGLANRRELRNKIQSLKSSSDRSYALLCLDLDGFKAVNDRYGHMAGDQLLVAVGQRLTGKTRSDDLACRVGGDEFIVVLNDIGEEGAKRRAAELIAYLSEPYELANDITACIGASIGIALDNSRTLPLESIVKQADDALYEAKRAGKGTYRVAPG